MEFLISNGSADSTISFVLKIAESIFIDFTFLKSDGWKAGEEIAVRQCVRGTARDARDIGRHLGPRDIQPVLCSVAVRAAARSPFPRPFKTF